MTCATITRDLPFDAYLARASTHFSALKHLDKSPLHYRHALRHERGDTSALRIGRATHALVLSGETPADVAVYEGPVRRGKAWDAFAEENAGKLILVRSELAKAEAMRAAVMAYAPAAELLSEGEPEVTIEWTHKVGHVDIPVRVRVDWLRGDEDGGAVELKTTRTIHPRAFARECASRLYHAQAALYCDGITKARDRPMVLPTIIAVENEPPHDVAVYRVPNDALEAGLRKVDDWMRVLAECMRTGHYPGVGGDAVVPLRLPDWALTEGIDDVDLEGIGG